jgi:hypothetical protein
MHEVTIEGYIYELQKDRFIVMAFNINKLKNIIATYGELNYVPLIDRNGIKVKYGFAIKMAKTCVTMLLLTTAYILDIHYISFFVINRKSAFFLTLVVNSYIPR